MKEDVHHLLWNCKIAKYVWITVGNALDEVISKHNLYFGVKNYITNFVISLSAYVIYNIALYHGTMDRKGPK